MDDLFTAYLVIGIALGLYLLPSIVALNRKVANKWSVVVINALLGWTLIGWAVALAMAVRDAPAKRDTPAQTSRPT